MLRGEELRPGGRGRGRCTTAGRRTRPKEVAYNPGFPIETFDFIVTDECHRSIYGLWRQVLEYFDAFLIGLTATPSKQTFGFFNQNLVMEYGHERAVADGVNVGYDVYRIKTQITEKGGKVEKGFYVDKRDKQHAAAAVGATGRRPGYEASGTGPRRGGAGPDPDGAADVQGRAATSCSRAGRGAEDSDLREGRLPRRGHRAHLPRGVRQGQRLLQEDHLPGRPGEKPGDLIQSFRNSPQPADRGDGGHDRHRHGHQAAGVPGLHARRASRRCTSSR